MNNNIPPAYLVFDKYATDYQTRFMDVSYYQASVQTFCKLLTKPQAQILEVACGPGNITRYILELCPKVQLLGTDLAPNMIALAKDNNPTATFKIMDGRNIQQIQQAFDGIVAAFFFPYLNQAETAQFITDAAAMLTTNGVLYISTMEDHYAKSGIQKGSKGDEVIMHYYEYDQLEKMLLASNFDIAEVSRVRTTMSNQQPVTDLMIVAQKRN
jgi:cyclopropane fatty-acyl-phospholipid synthase-like methyltransferase